jgi:hypothetical protein
MRKIRAGAATISLLLTFAFVASAQATITTSNVTAPADGTLLFQNVDTNPSQTFTVSGTTDGSTSDLFDIDCFSGTSYRSWGGPSGNGIALTSTGSFSVTNVPESQFVGVSCHLVVVPHGSTTPPGSNYTGPRVGFSEFTTNGYKTPHGALYDYYFEDATTEATSGSDSIDDCGPYPYLVDGTSAMNPGNSIFNCASSFYTSASDRIDPLEDLPSSEIEVDGQNAYGSYGADTLFSSSDARPGFPALTVSLDSFDSSNGNAQTTESEPLVKCTPEDIYVATSSSCTAFASTGIALKRVTDYTNNGRVATITDTYSSTDGQAHSLDLKYETDLNDSTAGWEFPGQTSFTTPSSSTDATDPGPSTAPGTLYAIDDISSALNPSLTNVVGAATFATPYNSVTFDDTIWGPTYPTALFDYQRMLPASGSTTITWSYATGTSLAEVQGYAAAAQAELRPVVTISSPANGATVTSSPVTVTGTAGGGSGVKSVTVNGVTATLSGGTWSASVPLTHGPNTLTASMTTNVGSTATASVTVTYAPPPRVSVKSKRFNGKSVLVKLACAASGSNCVGKMTLRYTETVVRHNKKRRITLVLASKHYSIGYGHTATIKAALSRTGKRLLKAHGKLLTKGTVTVTQANGRQTTASTFKLTLKQPAKRT